MENDSIAYHEAVIFYNDKLAEAATELAKAPELDGSVCVQWLKGIANQHKAHSARHRRLLSNLEAEANDETVDETDAELSEDAIAHLEEVTEQSQPVESAPDATEDPTPVYETPDLEEAAAPVEAVGETQTSVETDENKEDENGQ